MEARQETSLSGLTPYPLTRTLFSFLLFVFLHIFADELDYPFIHTGTHFCTHELEPPLEIIGYISYSHIHAINMHPVQHGVKENRTGIAKYFNVN